ncbi:potassium/sodium hyperpolarization-activated cyclic nucleotide-gated channel 1-like [Athalia rosae]|uniref:potassium/sodium hyperpolarization-activated cyclic nucleotide-gated channel 1-like n=1 Tax=Athalia rosae TaxID=37344 RepID=UPI0020333931|nr:potassium/sodium hyperpolarization-activated cyclic nucleotide-gated channel 1-like [Athalia rosae]
MMLKARHDCEINLKHDEVLFIPGKGPLRTTLGALRRACMVSDKNPSARKFLRSRASIVYEKRRHLRHYKYVVHPFSPFNRESFHRHWWDFGMILSMYGIFFILPYQAAFDMYRNVHGWTWTKNGFIEFIFRYYDEIVRVVQLDLPMIARNYVYSGTFVFDLLGSIPTDIFFIGSWDELIVSRELATLVMVFRGISFYLNTKRLANAYDMSIGLVKILMFVGTGILVLHWQACIHYIVPMAVTSLGIPQKPSEMSWINQHAVWNESLQLKYRTSLFRAIAMFTCSGFNGAPPATVEDQYLAIFVHIAAVTVVCTLVGALMQVFKGMNSSRLKYEAMTVQLKQYMRHKQLPLENQQRFLSYYEFRYQNNYFREPEILGTVSAQISQEIGMHSCRKLVENVTFFNNLPMSLLIRIVALLRSEIFLTNDVIVRANQPGDCMYFIASGTVAIYTKSGKEVCHLEDGAHFGEIALVMPDERRVASVVAVEICELYRLERADFVRTIHPYPMLWERIKKIAMERHERTTILNAQ